MRLHVHGVGGKGAAPLAGLALLTGWTVSGDDIRANHRTRALAAAGVSVSIGRNQVPDDRPDVVATSRSITGVGGEETLHVLEALLRVHNRREIAVIGSLGKSTQATVLMHAMLGARPWAFIGADVPNTLCGAQVGSGDMAIVEACEYKASYMALHPEIVCVTNIEQNHEDYFGPGTAGFRKSMTNFLDQNVPATGCVYVGDDSAVRFLVRNRRRTVTVGTSRDAQHRVTLQDVRPGGSTFELRRRGSTMHGAAHFHVPAHGPHLVRAAAIASVVAIEYGLSVSSIQAGFDELQLPDRRMSVRHEGRNLVVVEDNARHPLQIDALVSGLRQRWPDHDIFLVASPWGTKNPRSLDEWARALSGAGRVAILPLGAAAQSAGGPEPEKSPETLTEMIRHGGTPAHTVSTIGDVLSLTEPCGRRRTVLALCGYDTSGHFFAEVVSRIRAETIKDDE